MYNLVGFQTRLKWGEQKRVFSMIPGLENAEFVRYGVMHRNTFLHSPDFLDAQLRHDRPPRPYFAGQMTGVEGYMEIRRQRPGGGHFAGKALRGLPPVDFTTRRPYSARWRAMCPARRRFPADERQLRH